MNAREIDENVYVCWYGKVLTGKVVENKPTGSVLDGMVAVRLTVQGKEVTALFTPGHVYSSENETSANAMEISNVEAPQRKDCHGPAVSPAWERVQSFKRAHWDEKHGHLKVEALDEFYQTWREGVRVKLGCNEHSIFHPMYSEIRHPDLGLSCERFASKKLKVTAKEQRSTGRITYYDAIQTSLFDPTT